MKKILMGLVAISFMLSTNVSFAEGTVPAIFTEADGKLMLTEVDGMLMLNGRIYDEPTVGEQVKMFTVVHIVSTLFYTNRQIMTRLYSGASIGEIMEAVKLYYKQNPLKKSRPIVEVVLAGCK